MAEHRVSASDTLGGLAELYYLTSEAGPALAHANRLSLESPLRPGQDLMLPARVMGYRGLSARAELQSVVDMVVYERRKDLVFVRVQENVYPDDMVAVAGKWLYVVSDGAVVVRAEAKSAGEWEVDSQLFGGKRMVGDQTIPLIAGRGYSFFVAPYELSSGAERYLLDQIRECLTVSHLQAATKDTTVHVRDAYLWALDLHHQLYLPKLEAWQAWVADEERASKLFIASTLKCLIEQKDPGWLYDSTDPLDLRNQLRPGEPERYIEQVYLAEEQKQRIAAERAMALLAEMVDSFDFRTLEKSALEQGGQPLEASVLAWACVLPGAVQTRPGREFAARLVADETRIPLAQIFSDAPEGNTLQFAQSRYLSNAALAIVKDLGPAWVARHRALHGIDPLQHIADYLERLSGEAPARLRGTYRQVHENLQSGRPLSHELKNPQRVRDKLVRKSGLAEALEAVEPPAILVKGERLADAFVRNFGVAQVGFRVVLEVVNLSSALSDLHAEYSDRKALGALGAVADGGALLAEMLNETLEVVLKESSKTALKRTVMGLGFLSGVCDCIEFGALHGEASEKHDYNAAVGHGIAAVGASMISLGSVVALSTTFGAGAVTATTGAATSAASLGTLLGILGAALVGAGALAARLCLDNSYEEFAKVCFLGTDHGMTPRVWPWASFRLPTPEIGEEMIALVQLMSNFRIAFEDDSGATIYPGFYRPGDLFEVYLERSYESHPPRSAHLLVSPASGEVRQHEGEPLADRSHVIFDAMGRAERIWISEQPATPSPHVARMVRSRLLQVRLLLKGGKSVPVPTPSAPEPKCVQAELKIGVFGPDLRSATSSQEDRRASPKFVCPLRPSHARIEPLQDDGD